MSYESTNILRNEARLKDVQDLIELLGYEYLGLWNNKKDGKIRSYYWFEKRDYESISGVELDIYFVENKLFVTTRTSVSRSYYDLKQQNKTIRFLRKYYGGTFITDRGRGRYLQPGSTKHQPAAAGCHLAFSSFGVNFIRARRYFDNRQFGDMNLQLSRNQALDRYSPRLLSNSFILTFLVSIFEDYWKSTYIALLKYSNNKEVLLKNGRIAPDRLVQVSNQEISIEEGFASSLSFANVSDVCRHFKLLDDKLDFARILQKPYRRRKKSLFFSLKQMTELRNKFIHEASSVLLVEDGYIKDLINILHDSIERCYVELTSIKGWKFDKTWEAGRLK